MIRSHRAAAFGRIIGERLELTDTGKAALSCWHQIARRHKSVGFDDFTVMPNQIIGIIRILNDTQPGSVEKIIRFYKNSLSQWCRQNGDLHFKWKFGYHDRTIRDLTELHQMRRYIVNQVP